MTENIGNLMIFKDVPLDILIGFLPRIPFDQNKLEWKKEEQLEGAEYLTLDDIAEQITKLIGGRTTIIVWVESALHGEIYQWGNYSDQAWYKHGDTKGYA